MEVAESSVARRVLREHVRERLGVQEYDLLFAIINSMFLDSAYQKIILQKEFKVACSCELNEDKLFWGRLGRRNKSDN